MLVAPPFSAFAQREERGPPRLEEQIPLRKPEVQIPLRKPQEQIPLRTQTFAGRVYHGQLAWRDGRWHHTMRNGRDGWWWDVGGYWYFYPQQIEGPPDYVSDVEVADEATAAPSPAAPATARIRTMRAVIAIASPQGTYSGASRRASFNISRRSTTFALSLRSSRSASSR